MLQCEDMNADETTAIGVMQLFAIKLKLRDGFDDILSA